MPSGGAIAIDDAGEAVDVNNALAVVVAAAIGVAVAEVVALS